MAKFQKGQSGNPRGRPKSESTQIRTELAKHSLEVISVLMAKVREGDTAALKMVLDRLSPPLKGVMPTVHLNLTADTLAGRTDQILTATAKGTISPDQCSAMVQSMAGLAKIIETTELIDRIEKLEVLSHGN